MAAIQDRKGQPCVYSSIFCQEGYCSDCEICEKWTLRNISDAAREKVVYFRPQIAIKELERVSVKR
jgi:hypothetical protein